MTLVRARAIRSLLAAVLAAGAAAACNLTDPAEDGMRLLIRVRPSEEVVASWRAAGTKTVVGTVRGVGIGAPTTIWRSTTTVSEGDFAELRWNIEIPNIQGGNFVARIAVANIAGDTIFRSPPPPAGQEEDAFGLLNGSEIELTMFVGPP